MGPRGHAGRAPTAHAGLPPHLPLLTPLAACSLLMVCYHNHSPCTDDLSDASKQLHVAPMSWVQQLNPETAAVTRPRPFMPTTSGLSAHLVTP